MTTTTAHTAPPEGAVTPGFYNAGGYWVPLAGDDHGFYSLAGTWVPTGCEISPSEVTAADNANVLRYRKEGLSFSDAAHAFFLDLFEGRVTVDDHGFLR